MIKLLPNHELRWLKAAAFDSNHLKSLVQRRVQGEPLQYIIGTQPFGDLSLRVRPPTLIPRPETENWVIQLAEKLLPSGRPPLRPLNLVDLGTGTGCIPLLLCHLWPSGSVIARGIDVSSSAVALANENAALCGISRSTFHAKQANFLHPDFPDGVIKLPVDILTSNPPYISADEYLQLSDEVAKYEDPNALLGGQDGLKYYRAIVNLMTKPGFLASDAVVALEVGHKQANDVCNIIRPTGFKTTIWNDPWGKQRTVVARR